MEQWNRTMKNFTANNTQKYMDVLTSMVEKYNNTYHRSIKLKPTDVSNMRAALNAKVNPRKATPPKFHVGDVAYSEEERYI